RLLAMLPDTRPVEEALGDEAVREALHEAAFAPRGPVWFAGSRAAAIRCLARFDAGTAREAVATALQGRDGPDPERYPAALAEIDPLGAGPFLLEIMRSEPDRGVRLAIGRVMSGAAGAGSGTVARLAWWTRDADASRRRAAFEMLGWVTGDGKGGEDAL